MAKNPTAMSKGKSTSKAAMAVGGKAFTSNKPDAGVTTGPRFKKGGMVAFEKSAADKKMDSKKGAPKEGSKKDMAMDRKAMSKGKK